MKVNFINGLFDKLDTLGVSASDVVLFMVKDVNAVPKSKTELIKEELPDKLVVPMKLPDANKLANDSVKSEFMASFYTLMLAGVTVIVDGFIPIKVTTLVD